MAGLYDRIIPGSDRVAVHFLTAAIILADDGIFTNVQIRDAINSDLITPLDAASETDLTNIVTEYGSLSAGSGARYLHRLESISLALEEGHFSNESTWRTYLGIV